MPKGSIEHIDAPFHSSGEGKKRVKKFVIDDDEQREEYEELMNRDEATIVKEQTNFDKLGRTSVTVW